jgi:hypothetical protein
MRGFISRRIGEGECGVLRLWNASLTMRHAFGGEFGGGKEADPTSAKDAVVG